MNTIIIILILSIFTFVLIEYLFIQVYFYVQKKKRLKNAKIYISVDYGYGNDYNALCVARQYKDGMIEIIDSEMSQDPEEFRKMCKKIKKKYNILK